MNQMFHGTVQPLSQKQSIIMNLQKLPSTSDEQTQPSYTSHNTIIQIKRSIRTIHMIYIYIKHMLGMVMTA